MVLQYLQLLLKTERQQTLTQDKQNQKWKVPHISFLSKFGIISQMITFWQAITRNSEDKMSQYIVRSQIQCDFKRANVLCFVFRSSPQMPAQSRTTFLSQA